MQKENEITLLVLAGGMGSRFGGLKQIQPMGPNGEFLIDYAIHDAIEAGFNKVVFLIKEENYEIFKETIGKRVEPYIKVEYCFQKNDNLPAGYDELKTRVKPLGTAHAILCCKDHIKGSFATINADDFLGKDAYIKAYEFLTKKQESDPQQHYGLVGYKVENTMTENGAVKRAVCEVKNDKLVKLTESSIERVNGEIIAKPLNGTNSFTVLEGTLVSLNMMLFNPSIFDYIEQKFPEYLANNRDHLADFEYLIPDVLFDSIQDKFATVDVIKTTATWYGVTYKEDLPGVKKALEELIEKKEYNKNLWKKI